MSRESKKYIREMLEQGANRYWTEVNQAIADGRFADTKAGCKLRSSLTEALGVEIEKWMADQGSRRASNAAAAYVMLKDALPPRVLAAITLTVYLNYLTRKPSKQELVVKIGSTIMRELNLVEYEQTSPEDYARARKWAAKATAEHKQKIFAMFSRKHLTTSLTKWSITEQVVVGAMLYEMVASFTGFSAEQAILADARKKPLLIVYPSERLLTWLATFHANGANLNAMYQPLLEEPRKWVSYNEGGVPEDLPSVPLVVSRNFDYEQELLQSAEITQVLEALNHIQAVAWKINTPVLEKIRQLRDNHVVVSKLVNIDPEPIPEKPEDIDTNEEARKRYRKEAALAYRANNETLTQRLQIHLLLAVSEKYKDHERFYFPQHLDFRGRVYPISGFLTTQGSELVKSMLLFADGKPITCEAEANWLAVHGANCWGEDKVAFEDRIEFINVMTPLIIEIAEGRSNEWMEAGDPFLFYAFCLEWAAFKREGFGFVTHLPVSVDGSNNGSQILGLLTRDADICTATNVLPTEKPHDIYKEVADKVQELVDALDQADPVVRNIQNYVKIDRSLVKKQVMTKPYSATLTSCRVYTKERLAEQLLKCPVKFTDAEIREMVMLLAKLIMQAMDIRMAGPSRCMQWLQACGKVIMKNSKTIDWITPLGLPVRQWYANTKPFLVSTHVFGKIRIRMREQLQTANKYKAFNGISPNFVHSLDAAALQLTTLTCKKLGINNLLCIHDSFGTLAADVEGLQAAIRHSYATIFSEDILQNLKSFWEERYNVSLPDVPQYGTAIVRDLLGSEYFFA